VEKQHGQGRGKCKHQQPLLAQKFSQQIKFQGSLMPATVAPFANSAREYSGLS